MQQYKKREEAALCEKKHLKPTKVKAHKYAFGQYPSTIEVTFPDESKQIYVHEDELWQNGYKRRRNGKRKR